MDWPLGSASGQRSSNEEMRDPTMNGEDETVVDEQQGNSTEPPHFHRRRRLTKHAIHSHHAHHITIKTRSRPQQSDIAHLHSRTADDAGKNHMAHPEMLLPIPDEENDVERFKSVVKFYLSGWHIRPPYVYPFALRPR